MGQSSPSSPSASQNTVQSPPGIDLALGEESSSGDQPDVESELSEQASAAIRQQMLEGAQHYHAGEIEAAIVCFQAISEQHPEHADAWHWLGCLAAQQKQFPEAIAHIKRAIQLRPNKAVYYSNLGNAYHEQEQFEEAIKWYKEAIVYNPLDAGAYRNLAVIYKKQGETARAMFNYGLAFQKQGQIEPAIEHFRKAIDQDEKFVIAYGHLSHLYAQQGNFTAAIEVCEQAVRVRPDSAAAHVDLGNVYRKQGILGRAIAFYTASFERNPNHPETHLSTGSLLLLLGEWEHGFPEYEWRFNTAQMKCFKPKTPMWKRVADEGASLKNSASNGQSSTRQSSDRPSLLLWNEQGLGDAIQFVRYAKAIPTQKNRVIISVQPNLVSLLQECLDGEFEIVKRGQCKIEDYDNHASLFSLPRIFGTTPATVPNATGYLNPPQPLRSPCILPDTSTYRIGIVWASDKRNVGLYRQKSCDPKWFMDLLEVGNLSIYSLQVGEDATQIEPWLELDRSMADPRVHDLSPLLKDFVDTASVIAQLDLVISIDTAVAHLAGAMGKPVWTLLPFIPDWRWLLDRQDTPWYTSMRLFRQPRHGDWASVFRQVRQKLEAVLAGESPLFPVDVVNEETAPLQAEVAAALDQLPKLYSILLRQPKFPTTSHSMPHDFIKLPSNCKITETGSPQSSSAKNRSQRASDRVIDTAGFNAVKQGRYGYIIYNKNDIYIGAAIEKYGEYSEAEISLFQQILKPGNMVVEVGANIGTHTLALSQIVGDTGRVYAYEPQRIVFQTLCGNMAINSIRNVECYQLAIASENGVIHVPDINYDHKGNFGGVAVSSQDKGDRVPAVTLDQILKDIKALDFLKVDVEGMEYQALSGGKAILGHHQPVLYVENDRIEKSKALIELIRSLGYRMFWHLPPLYNPQNYEGDRENIYPGIVSVNMLCIHQSKSMNIAGLKEVVDSDSHPMKKSD